MKKFPSSKLCTCPRCRILSRQVIFDYKYGIYIPTNDKNVDVDLTKLSHMMRKKYNLEYIKVGNYECIQIKPNDNREVADDFLYVAF